MDSGLKQSLFSKRMGFLPFVDAISAPVKSERCRLDTEVYFDCLR
jgi:hypothetical protein